MRRRRPPDGGAPPSGSAYVAGLRMLGRRDLTRHELTTRLIDKGYAAADVEAALDRLTAAGALDDRRTAGMHVRTASRLKGRGRLRIARELAARGLSRAIIDTATAELTDEADLDAIRRFVARKQKTARLSLAERRRLFQQLLRRGFASSAISKVLGRPVELDES